MIFSNTLFQNTNKTILLKSTGRRALDEFWLQPVSQKKPPTLQGKEPEKIVSN